MFQQAFVTHEMMEHGGDPVAAVVRANRIESGRVIIQIAPLYPPPALQDLIIMIDSEDLAEVQRLLGEERPMVVSADDEGVVPDEDIAWHALRQIADLDQVQADEGLTWKDVAMRCIDYAQEALALARLEEDQDGTATDA